MARPRLTNEEKLLRMIKRFDDCFDRGPDDACWPWEGPEYLTAGSRDRFRPRAVAWMVKQYDEGKELNEIGLPEPRHIYYIANFDTCIVKECVNPKHLKVAGNVSTKPPKKKDEEPVTFMHPDQHRIQVKGRWVTAWKSIEAYERYMREKTGDPNFKYVPKNGVPAE